MAFIEKRAELRRVARILLKQDKILPDILFINAQDKKQPRKMIIRFIWWHIEVLYYSHCNVYPAWF